MKLVHLMVFLFFVSIFLYLGLKNPEGSTALFKGSTSLITGTAKTLQGR